MSLPDHRIPVTIVTGFLGSGKTTLLRRLLLSPGVRNVAVLVNELAEIGIDQKLLVPFAGGVQLLKNGCICCAVQEDLRRCLTDLLAGGAPTGAISRVVIETTGLADPVPILNTFVRDAVLKYHFRIGNIVTAVDCVNVLFQLERFRECTKQIAAADLIVLTKTDLADREAVAAAGGAVERLNPAVPVLHSAISDHALVSRFLEDSVDIADSAAKFRRLISAGSTGFRLDRGAIRRPDNSRHDPSVTPFCISVVGPFDWSAFALWLTMLLHAHGDKVLRVKGILNIAGSSTPLLLNGVQNLIHRPVHLERWPDEDRRSELVFIVSDLDPEAIRLSFETFVGAAAEADVGLEYF